jgi:hypothetical protein
LTAAKTLLKNFVMRNYFLTFLAGASCIFWETNSGGTTASKAFKVAKVGLFAQEYELSRAISHINAIAIKYEWIKTA